MRVGAINLPRTEALAFVANCRAFYKAAGDTKEQERIAFDQLHRFREYDPRIRVWDVLNLFDMAPAELDI